MSGGVIAVGNTKRKTIAVCVTGYDNEYETRVVDGVYRACQAADINLLVFASLLRKPELNSERVLPENVIHGETEIFQLINYDLIDGIIMLGESFVTPDVVKNVWARAREHHIPVVNVSDPAHELDINIILSNSVAMEFVMRHLVEEHGVRRINFIGGFPGNLQTEERLNAYKNILTQYHIPVEEKRIAYGEFWNKAIECTKKFMEVPKEEQPEAIVCASDAMALFCMDYLKSVGIRIPEDIIVTGFDGVKDCELYSPTLTTVRRAFGTAGEMAVSVLNDLWNGRKVEKTYYVESELVKNESCGCMKRVYDDSNYTGRYEIQNRFIEFNTYILEMNSNFGNVTDSKELYQDTVRGANFFKLKQMFLCLCTDAENQSRSLEQAESGNISNSLTERMVSMIQFGHEVPVGTEFASAGLLPIDLLNREKPIFYAFSPLYFKDHFLGYMAYEPSETSGSAGDLFATWILQISNNAGSFYMKNELQYVVDKLEGLYERDPLTGLYNRRGMNHNRKVVEHAARSGELVTVLCADVDNLKVVNDAYGHEGGDTVIIRTAMALSQALPEGAVCVRTGGDEFCAVFAHDESVSVDDMTRHIDEILTDFNKNSGLPYRAGCSCGYCSARISDVSELDDMMNIADENMYKVKVAKKAVRK